MLETAFSKEAIRIRRDRRDREREGWEFVGEGGGRLWELYRGYRIGYRITEARVSACGRGIWIKTADTIREHNAPEVV